MESTMQLIFLVVFLKVISAQPSPLELVEKIKALEPLLTKLSSPQFQQQPEVISAQPSPLQLLEEIKALEPLLTKLSSPQCQQRPEVKPTQCCVIPDLFDKETNAGCIRPDDETLRMTAVRGSPECAERKCILRNNDLLLDNEEIDKDAFKQHLDEWVATRREWMPAVKAVKDVCLGNKPLIGFMLTCDADGLIWCISANLLQKCPNWLDTDSCAATRAFMENCLPYNFDKDIPK
ncbi:uncharacterized protein LOC134794193 [Cydia splendana]|uniref:uncharacterized protein LOC134794193 n=1 Tax=Cydia splendana TaxID=1100963 RepID=UPI0028F4B1A1